MEAWLAESGMTEEDLMAAMMDGNMEDWNQDYMKQWEQEHMGDWKDSEDMDAQNWDMSSMGDDMKQWEEEWAQGMQDWEQGMQDWDQKEGGDANMGLEGDWFGGIVNNPCTPKCEIKDCEFGEFCTLTYCTDECSGETTCDQAVTWDWVDWEEADCIDGPVDIQRVCEEECVYDECDESHQYDDQCWVEYCNDGCGYETCNIWYQIDGEWYGEYCEEEESAVMFPEFRVGDALGAIMQGGKMYEETIKGAFNTFCPEGDEACK